MNFTQLKKLLRNYLANDSTNAQRRVVDLWYESFSTKQNKIPELDDPAQKEMLRKQIWERLPTHTIQHSWLRRNRHIVLRLSVAAVVALVGIWGYVASVNRSVVDESAVGKQGASNYITNTGIRERKLLILPDSSRVWLNANSTLQVDSGYAGTERLVSLEGEAFFDVRPNRSSPFVVKTSHLKIRVLGTAFNVMSYAQTPDIRVVVDHGKVAVMDSLDRTLHQLTEGQSLVYAITRGEAEVRRSSSGASWREGHVVLEQASFQEVSQAVYNMYGIRIRSARQEPKRYSYNLHLHAHRTLEQTMEIICSIHRLKYRRKQDEIVLY